MRFTFSLFLLLFLFNLQAQHDTGVRTKVDLVRQTTLPDSTDNRKFVLSVQDGQIAWVPTAYTYVVGDAVVKANGAGVSFTKSPGVCRISVPENVDLSGVTIFGSSADLAPDMSFRIIVDFENINYNKSDSDFYIPNLDVVNLAARQAGGPTPSLPFVYDEGSSPQRQLVQSASGEVEVKILNLQVYTEWAVKITF